MPPHAEQDLHDSSDSTSNDKMSSAPMTNGETPSSKVLSHLQSYPVIHDTLDLYKSNPYGAKSLQLLSTTYARLISPLTPYLQTPYSLLSPYLSRADELGDNGLSKVDSRFPIVKEDTGKLKEQVQGYAGYPFKVVRDGREYVLGTYNDEYSKTRGEEGWVKTVKAGISTELKVGLDAVALVRGYLGRGKEVGQKKVEEVKN